MEQLAQKISEYVLENPDKIQSVAINGHFIVITPKPTEVLGQIEISTSAINLMYIQKLNNLFNQEEKQCAQ